MGCVALEESDDESSGIKAETCIDDELNNLDTGIGCDDESVTLIAGADLTKEDCFLQETKVSFEHVKKNMTGYSKKKLESLSLVLIDAYVSVCDTKENILEDYCDTL